MNNLTALIRKGDKQFVALCPEIDVVSQGYTIEETMKNLKEAVELYIEEMGFPEDAKLEDTFIVKFNIETNGKTSTIVR